MNKKNFYVGLGMGIAACGLVSMIFKPRKRHARSAVAKALMQMSEIADSVCDNMPW